MTRYLNGEKLLETLNEYAKVSRDNASAWCEDEHDRTSLGGHVAHNFRQMADNIETIIQIIETGAFDIGDDV